MYHLTSLYQEIKSNGLNITSVALASYNMKVIHWSPAQWSPTSNLNLNVKEKKKIQNTEASLQWKQSRDQITAGDPERWRSSVTAPPTRVSSFKVRRVRAEQRRHLNTSPYDEHLNLHRRQNDEDVHVPQKEEN